MILLNTIWKSDVNLNDICEPYYRIAKQISKASKIKEENNTIFIECPFSCQKYGQKTEQGGKLAIIPMDESVYEKPIKPCDNCVLKKQMAYCPLKLAQYIKYMENFQPEEEKKLRETAAINSNYSSYKELPASPYYFTETDLNGILISKEGLFTAKILIDKFLSIPTFTIDHDKVMFAFSCPEAVFQGIAEDMIQSASYRKKILSYGDEVFQGKPIQYNIIVPLNKAILTQYIQRTLCGPDKPPNATCNSVIYLLLAYTLLQTGQFDDVMFKATIMEQVIAKDIKTQFGPDVPPLLKASNQFYGLLQANDTIEAHSVPMGIAHYIRQKCQLCVPIRRMTMLRFAEGFIGNIKDGHNDSFEIEYNLPEDRVIHIIDELQPFLEYAKQAKEHGITFDRAKMVQEVISFFEGMHDDYYFLLCGTEKELDEFIKISKNIKWTFSEKRLVIKEYSNNKIVKILQKECHGLSFNKANTFIKENRNSYPFKNEKLISYLREYYNRHKCLPAPPEKTEDAQKQLDALTGLEDVKKQATRICNLWKFMKKGKKEGIDFPSVNTHMLFKGNPGTGKTTVARILADAMYDYGVCKEKKLVEVHCPDLVAGYVGQTALKTRKKIEKAIGGVLFIDEAYALTQARGNFGEESLAVIVKMMEDHKDDLTIIFAGYPEEMESFMTANPGLQSRIGYTFNFKDYSKEELAEIFENKMKHCHFNVTEQAKEKAKKIIANEIGKPNFGNGRFIDKIVQETIIEKAQKETFSKEIDAEDIPDITQMGKAVANGKKPIGFSG